MATFWEKDGKVLTEEELQRMMESERPLTDEELGKATGGAREWEFGDLYQDDICKCGQSRFLVLGAFENHDSPGDSGNSQLGLVLKCVYCGLTIFRLA